MLSPGDELSLSETSIAQALKAHPESQDLRNG